jgi:hypothetical protein
MMLIVRRSFFFVTLQFVAITSYYELLYLVKKNNNAR